ncbi:MAG: hypothetical protein ACFFEL_03975 [Candidatus Thorarchaeota archaeon]
MQVDTIFRIRILDGKIRQKKEFVAILGIVFALLLGLLGGFVIAPVQYPFMITELNWVGFPEIRRVGLSLVFPDFVLFQESINFQSFSLLTLLALLAISILGSILGIFLGIRYRASDEISPWAQSKPSK